MSKASPAAPVPQPKRGGNLEDPSPRSRKRARGSMKEEEGFVGPETPRFDTSLPPSPASGMGMPLPPPGPGQPQGQFPVS